MVYGDYYNDKDLLGQLHDLLKEKYDIDMYFSYKEHDTSVIDSIHVNFCPAVVLGGEWAIPDKKNKKLIHEGVLLNIDDDFLRNPTHMKRILSACYGQGKREDMLITLQFAAMRLWLKSGREEGSFETAWKESESNVHDGSTLRYYSRISNEGKHFYLCRRGMRLLKNTSFTEAELRDFFLKAVGDNVIWID